jgi:hypothetical protein
MDFAWDESEELNDDDMTTSTASRTPQVGVLLHFVSVILISSSLENCRKTPNPQQTLQLRLRHAYRVPTHPPTPEGGQ